MVKKGVAKVIKKAAEDIVLYGYEKSLPVWLYDEKMPKEVKEWIKSNHHQNDK